MQTSNGSKIVFSLKSEVSKASKKSRRVDTKAEELQMSYVTEIANDRNERLTAVRIVFYAHESVTLQRIPTLV